jgi:hypothetical protein
MGSRSPLLITAWVGTLLSSFFINIIWREFFSGDDFTGFYIRLGIILVLLTLTFLWQVSGSLRRYWLILLALCLADVLGMALQGAPAWLAWYASSTSMFVKWLGEQSPRLLLTLCTWLVLILMGMKRKDYFLAIGQLDAPNEPISWLGEKKIKPWTQYGREWAINLFVVTLIVLGLGIRPSLNSLVLILPWIPTVLFFAALNAFNENFANRAAFLPHILPLIGKKHSLLLASFFFGIYHFYGMPPGAGIILPTFLGWVAGKAMIETRGMVWSWIIQWPLDVIVFSIFAIQFVSGA